MFFWGDVTPGDSVLTPQFHHLEQAIAAGALDQAPVVDVTKTAQEESMRAQIFIVDGIMTMIFFPLRLFKLLGADSKKSKSFFFPLGNKIACVPLLSLFMWACVIGLCLQLYSAPNPKDLRSLNYVDVQVSIGEPTVGLTLFAAVAAVVAAAVSHHPRFVRWDKSVTNVLEEIPFAQRAENAAVGGVGDATAAGSPRSENPLAMRRVSAEHTPVTLFADQHTVTRHTPPGHLVRVPSPVPSTQRLLGGMSPPPAPLERNPLRNNMSEAGSPRQTDFHSVSHAASPTCQASPKMTRKKAVDFETMSGPMPRRYVAFSHILMDEVPPLGDQSIHFIYDSAEWFEPQRGNRQHLDRSLALFREVFTQQQKEELEAQLERRRRARVAGPNSAASVEYEQDMANIALVNADTADWKPADLFKFTIGDHIRRNGEMPFMEVSFDGERAVTQGDRFVVSNRMWHEDCALYCVEGGVETHQWQAIEALFDVDEEIALDGTRVPTKRQDKQVSTESLLLAMSGRDSLRRLDPYANGNAVSSESAMYVPPWVAAASVLLSLVLSLVPIVVRYLQGGGLHASASLGDLLSAYGSVFLVTTTSSSLLVFLSTTLRSLANYDDVMDTFTEVTLGAASNKWYPLLNWYETNNIRTWYHLREHITTSFKVHYNSRLAAAYCVLMVCSSWSLFTVAYCLSYPSRSRPTADGWLFEITLLNIPLLWQLRQIFDHAVNVNERFLHHRSALAHIQVAMEEEIMLVAARTVNRVPGLQVALLATMTNSNSSDSTVGSTHKLQGLSNQTIANRSSDFQYLLDAKTLLDDVQFAVVGERVPLIPFGIAINRHLLQFIYVSVAANIVGLALILAGFVLNSWRWKY